MHSSLDKKNMLKEHKKVAIIGLGVVGGATYEDMMEILKKKELGSYKLFGVDINKEVINKYLSKYQSSHFFGGMSTNIPQDMDIYIVSVYSPEQIEQVFASIPKEKAVLIVIESTVPPELSKRLLKNKGNTKLTLFPHRFNPNDPEHRVFNLKRVLGGADKESEKAALDFYKQFMNLEDITIVSYFIAALSKPAENAYRFIEIAIAEDWKSECARLGISFEELRKSMNTKWNIDLKEARDGIGGTCLPKDSKFIKEFFSKSKLIKSAIEVDEEYKKKTPKRFLLTKFKIPKNH